MKLFYFCLATFLLSFTKLTAQTITSITSTESRCSASGTLTVTATGGTTPYEYAITAGPIPPRPNQSPNVFEALPPGTYTVRVTDKDGKTATRTATVTGNYIVSAPTHVTTSPYCVGGSDGKIAVTVPTTTGRAPYRFQLTAPAAYATSVITPGTNTYTFTNLPQGSYTYQVSDSCGNIQTRTVSVDNATYSNLAVSGNATAPLWGFTKVACDSVDLTLNTVGGKAPYTIKIFLNGVNSPATTMTARYGVAGASGASYSGGFRVPYTTACASTHSYTITDSCGKTFSGAFVTHSVSYTTSNNPTGCTGTDLDAVTKGFKAPLTYSWAHSGGTTVQIDDPHFKSMPAGPSTLTVTDACGASCSYFVNIVARVKKITLSKVTNLADYDSTSGVQFSGMTNLNKPFVVSVLSGPASYRSVKHNNISVNINYPIKDTVPSITNNAYLLRNLPIGNYRVAFIDSCGFTDTLSFSVTAADVRLLKMEEMVISGCIGANSVKIKTDYNTTQINCGYSFRRISPSLINYTNRTIPSLIDSFTYNNLSAGTYVVGYYFNTNGLPLFGAGGLNTTKFDTVIIAPYTQPVVTTATQAVACAGAPTGTITINATGGSGAYTYEITSPVAVGPQASNVFTGLASPGTYTVRASDTCGNSNTYSISMAPLTPPNVTADQACATVGMPIKLTADTIYNATYSWTGPGGYTTTGRSMTLPAYTTLQKGIYTVTLSLPGCGSVTKDYEIKDCFIMPVILKSFDAQVTGCKTKLKWVSATEQAFSSYKVEYSRNGSDFSVVGTVSPLGDNSTYSFIHDPAAGKAFYRLTMLDVNGNKRYSKIIYLNINCNGNTVIAVYPNPVKDKVTITGLSQQSTIRLLTVTGQELAKVVTLNTTYELDITKFSAGTYLLQVMQNDGTIQTIKLNKQ